MATVTFYRRLHFTVGADVPNGSERLRPLLPASAAVKRGGPAWAAPPISLIAALAGRVTPLPAACTLTERRRGALVRGHSGVPAKRQEWQRGSLGGMNGTWT